MSLAIATCLFAISCATAPLQPLRINSEVWIGYEPLLLARDLGYFDEAPIQIIEVTDHVASMRRFMNGDVEMSTMTLDSLLENAALQAKIRAFLVMDFSDGADALIAQPDIEQISDLQGKRIGILPSPLGKLMLVRALESVNLTLDDVTIVTVGIPEQEAAFLAKEVDALTTYGPVLTQLQANGGQVLFDSTQTPGEIVDLLAGSEDLIDTHSQQLKLVVEGWFQALDYIETNSDNAIARIADREGLTPEQVRQALNQLHYLSLEENIAVLEQTDTEAINGMKKLAQFMESNELLDTVVDPTTLLDIRVVETLL
ncbi:MAG: ABC transporter substrate-binding protein [Cyanobacteria bacterium J06638_22]